MRVVRFWKLEWVINFSHYTILHSKIFLDLSVPFYSTLHINYDETRHKSRWLLFIEVKYTSVLFYEKILVNFPDVPFLDVWDPYFVKFVKNEPHQ